MNYLQTRNIEEKKGVHHQRSRSFKDLIVWQKAHEFVLNTYTFSRRFPQEESNGLTSQFRQAATSVATNIAEGFKQTNPTERTRLLTKARGSLEVCNYYLVLTTDLSYGTNKELQELSAEVGSLLDGSIKSIRNNLSLNFQ